jgi:arylamine N-acetyltransferase
MAAQRPTYTEFQLKCYLKRINFEPNNELPKPTFITLKRLIAGHLASCPFENLSLHYTTEPRIDLDIELVFEKFVNRHRGGYCMEHNGLFSTVLKSLGFQNYNIGARVFTPMGLTGWAHMGIIVTIGGTEYLVDVGFGGNNLTAPLPIFRDGEIIEEPINGLEPERHRVRLEVLPGAAKRDYKTWVLQYQRDSESGWRPLYCFEKDIEFFEKDYEV